MAEVRTAVVMVRAEAAVAEAADREAAFAFQWLPGSPPGVSQRAWQKITEAKARRWKKG